MKKYILLFVMIWFSPSVLHAATFEEAVKDSLDVSVITSDTYTTTEELDLSHYGLTSLEGIASFRNLRVLDLSHNNLNDAEELQGMRTLEELYIHNNELSSARGFENLGKLQVLSLSSNRIKDVAPLGSLTSLVELRLNSNDIDGVEALKTLSGLERLFLNDNELSSLKGVAGLEELIYLWADHNDIRSIEELKDLTELQSLHLQHNDISEAEVVMNFSRLQDLHLQHNRLPQEGELLQWLKAVPSLTYTYFPQEELPMNVTLDPSLEAAIRAFLKKPESSPFTEEELWTTEVIDISGKGVESLEGIGAFPNLRELDVSDNDIRDLGPIASLDLEKFYANENDIENLYPLRSQSGLTHLGLRKNRIETVAFLNVLEEMEWLNVSDNAIFDIYALEEMEELRELHLTNNQVKSIAPLASLEHLHTLWLDDNRIQDLSPLASFRKLELLHAGKNRVEDVTPLRSVRSLSDLRLPYNNIQTVEGLERLEGLVHLDLSHNEVEDVTPLAELENLQTATLDDNNLYDLRALHRLKNLETLHIRGNRLLLDFPGQKGHLPLSPERTQQNGSVRDFGETFVKADKVWTVELTHTPASYKDDVAVIDEDGMPQPIRVSGSGKKLKIHPPAGGYDNGTYSLLIHRALPFTEGKLASHVRKTFHVSSTDAGELNKTLQDVGGTVLPYDNRSTDVIIRSEELSRSRAYLLLSDGARFVLTDDQNGYHRATGIPAHYSRDVLMGAEIIYD